MYKGGKVGRIEIGCNLQNDFGRKEVHLIRRYIVDLEIGYRRLLLIN